MGILRFDAWGNALPAPADRMNAQVARRAADPRDAEIAALKARVAELEAALVTATATASATATAKKIKPAPAITAAKPKDEPWKAFGLSERTYYRRKAAGTL